MGRTSRNRKEFTEILLASQVDIINQLSCANKIFEIVYDELRYLASVLMRRERPAHTLQPTALVHEAYCRLVDQTRVGWESQTHFFGIASRAMRQILVDHARHRGRAKRGGGWHRVTLDENLGVCGNDPVELFELEEALNKLAEMDERMARVVEMRIFGGMTAKEVAHQLGVSRWTVQDDWRLARSWLCRELSGEATP